MLKFGPVGATFFPEEIFPTFNGSKSVKVKCLRFA